MENERSPAGWDRPAGEGKLILEKRRGEDGYRSFSVRMRTEIVEQLDHLSAVTDRSRNELISTLLVFALGAVELP